MFWGYSEPRAQTYDEEVFAISMRSYSIVQQPRPVWSDGMLFCSIFGHLTHWQFAQQPKIAVVGSKFCQMLVALAESEESDSIAWFQWLENEKARSLSSA